MVSSIVGVKSVGSCILLTIIISQGQSLVDNATLVILCVRFFVIIMFPLLHCPHLPSALTLFFKVNIVGEIEIGTWPVTVSYPCAPINK